MDYDTNELLDIYMRVLEEPIALEQQIEILSGIRSHRTPCSEERERYEVESKSDVWTEEPTGPDIGYLIRTSSKTKRSVDSFTWPDEGYVSATKGSILVNSTLAGIHGLLDGRGDWNTIMPHPEAIWQIVAVRYSECKPCILEWAQRAPRGWVVYSGDALGAMRFIIPVMMSSVRLHELIIAHRPGYAD
jgi:hypothetical protein